MFKIGLGTLSVGLKLDRATFDTGIKSARASLSGFGKMAGTVAAGGLVALGAAAANATSRYADLEHRLKSAAAVSGDGAAAFEHFRKTALEGSNDVEFFASDLADSLRFASMAGLSASDSMDTLSDAMNVATATSSDIIKTTDYLTNTMSAFRYEIGETGRVSDVMVAGLTSANITLDDLAKSYEYVGALSASFGQDITTTTALLGVLGDAQLKGEKSGVILRNMFTRLVKPMRTTRKSMEILNVSLSESPNKFHDLITVIEQLEKAQVKMSKADFAEHMSRVFGDVALAGVTVLLGKGSKALRQYEKDLRNAGGTAEKVAKEMRGTISNQLKILRGRFDNAAIRAGQVFAPALVVANGAAKKLTKGILGSKEGFRKLQNITADAIDAFKVLVPIMTNVLKVSAWVAIGVDKITTGLRFMAAGVELAAMGLGKLGIAYDVLNGEITREEGQRGFDSIGRDRDKLLNDLKNIQKDSTAFYKKTLSFVDGLEGMGASVTKVFGDMSDAVRKQDHEQFNALASAAALAAKMKNMGDKLPPTGKAIRDITSELELLERTLKEIEEVELSALKDLSDLRVNLKDAKLAGVEEMGKKLNEQAKKRRQEEREIADMYAETVADVSAMVRDGHKNQIHIAMQNAFADVDAIFDIASQAVQAMFDGEGGGGLLQGIFAGVQEAAALAANPAAAVAAGLKAFSMSLIQTALETEKGQAQLQALGDAFTDIFGDSFVVDLLSALDGVHGMFLTVIHSFSSFGDLSGAMDFAGRVLFNVIRVTVLQFMGLATVFLTLKTALIAVPKLIVDAMVGLVDTINGALKKLPFIDDEAIQIDGLRSAQSKLTSELERSKDQVVDMAQGMKELATMTYGEAKAKSESAQAEARARRELDELTDSLKNAPSGFKLASARFAATGGGTPTQMAGGSSYGGGDNTINIYGVSDTGGVLKELARRNLIRTGSSYASNFHANDAFERLTLVG